MHTRPGVWPFLGIGGGGATQIFPEHTKWRRIMVLEDKRQLALGRVAQAQLSSQRRVQIMFGHFVKGKEIINDTKCKPGGNVKG